MRCGGCSRRVAATTLFTEDNVGDAAFITVHVVELTNQGDEVLKQRYAVTLCNLTTVQSSSLNLSLSNLKT